MGNARSFRRGSALSVAFVLALYWPAISGLGFFFERDIWLYWVPHVEWAVRTLASGLWPQWNPYKGFGAPFMSDPSCQFFYPPALLSWVLPPRMAYTFLVVAHSILGVIGAYRLLRPRLRSPKAATVGAIVFVGAGPLVSSANLWHHFSSAMYMPWVLDAFLRLRSGRSRFTRLACLTALQALAGSADVCVMTGLTLLLLLPVRPQRIRTLLPKLAMALATCVSLAAVQWLPTVLLAAKTPRAGLESWGQMHWSVAPASLVDLVLPLTGAAHSRPEEEGDVEERLRLIPWLYMGASTLPLLILGARRAPRGGLLLLGSILLSMGRHAPVAIWIGSLPIISSFRFPSKILWLVSAYWATLTAIGLADLLRKKAKFSLPGVLLGIAFLGVAVWVRWFGPVSETDSVGWARTLSLVSWTPLALGSVLVVASATTARRRALALVAIIGIDLLVVGRGENAYSTSDLFTIRPTIVDELVRLGARRVHVFQDSRVGTGRFKTPSGWSEKEAYSFALGQFLLPPQSVRWDIKGSFDGDFTGLAPPAYSALGALAHRKDTVSLRVLQLAGVTHALQFPTADLPMFPVVAQVKTFNERPVLVLEVPEPLPQAYVVHKVRLEPSMADGIRTLTSPGFDPRRLVVRVSGSSPTLSSGAEASTGDSEAQIEEETSGRIVVRTTLSSPGTLVVLSGYSEGWQARVDGQPARVVPANLIFQSVDLPAGRHRIEFVYSTPGLLVGLVLSSLAWGWLAWQRLRPSLRRRVE